MNESAKTQLPGDASRAGVRDGSKKFTQIGTFRRHLPADTDRTRESQLPRGHTAFEDNDPEIAQEARFSERCAGESLPQDDKELDQAGLPGSASVLYLEAQRPR